MNNPIPLMPDIKKVEKKLTLAERCKELLSPIPDDEFICERFTNEKDRCCAIGHLMRLQSAYPSDYSYKNCADIGQPHHIRELSIRFLGHDLSTINNCPVGPFRQQSPKERVMTALDRLINCGQ